MSTEFGGGGGLRDVNLLLFKVATLSLLRVNNSGWRLLHTADRLNGELERIKEQDANPGPSDGRCRWPLFEGRQSRDFLAWSFQICDIFIFWV